MQDRALRENLVTGRKDAKKLQLRKPVLVTYDKVVAPRDKALTTGGKAFAKVHREVPDLGAQSL